MAYHITTPPSHSPQLPHPPLIPPFSSLTTLCTFLFPALIHSTFPHYSPHLPITSHSRHSIPLPATQSAAQQAARHAADLTPLKRWASESQQSDHTTYLSAGAWPADAAAVRPTASVHSGGGDGIQQHHTHSGSGTRHHTHCCKSHLLDIGVTGARALKVPPLPMCS